MLNIFMLFYCIALKGKANETEAKPNHDHVGYLAIRERWEKWDRWVFALVCCFMFLLQLQFEVSMLAFLLDG